MACEPKALSSGFAEGRGSCRAGGGGKGGHGVVVDRPGPDRCQAILLGNGLMGLMTGQLNAR